MSCMLLYVSAFLTIYLIKKWNFIAEFRLSQHSREEKQARTMGIFCGILDFWSVATLNNCDQTNHVMIKTVFKIQQCRSSRSSESSTSARSSWRRHNGRNLTATSFHLPCTADLCILGSTKSSMLPIPLRSLILPIPSGYPFPRLPIPSGSIRQNSYFWSKNTIFSPRLALA